jgi:hypothetical protein
MVTPLDSVSLEYPALKDRLEALSRRSDFRGVVRLLVDGLGIIVYSPAIARRYFEEGSDSFDEYTKRIADHVEKGHVVGFNTGEGEFVITFLVGRGVVVAAEALGAEPSSTLTLALEVEDDAICVRDCHDLMRWGNACAAERQVPVARGMYEMTVHAGPELVARDYYRHIIVHLRPTERAPRVHVVAVPCLLD